MSMEDVYLDYESDSGCGNPWCTLCYVNEDPEFNEEDENGDLYSD